MVALWTPCSQNDMTSESSPQNFVRVNSYGILFWRSDLHQKSDVLTSRVFLCVSIPDCDCLALEPKQDCHRFSRNHTQPRAQRTEEQIDVVGTAQTVATTTPIEERGTDRQTDIHTTHQSEHSILLEAPSLFVGPNLSGLTCHALEIYSETSSQLSEVIP